MNYGSDIAFLRFNQNSSFLVSGSENVRLTLGVFNDFENASQHADSLDLQGGHQLTFNIGLWDSELNSAIGTPPSGNYLGKYS